MRAARRIAARRRDGRADLALSPAELPDLDAKQEVDVTIAFAAMARPRLLALCEGTTTSEACWHALEAEVARAEADASGVQVARIFPQAAHDDTLRVLYAIGLPAFARYVRRGLQSHAAVRALPVLFVHRRLALAGTCPDAPTLEAAIASLPLADGFGGRFEVLPSTLAYRPLDVCAPAWLAPTGAGRVRLPLLDAYCPAFAVSDAPVPVPVEPTNEQ